MTVTPDASSSSAPPPSISDRRLLLWMFAFLRPVWRLVALACLYLALWIGAELLTVRQTAQAINRIELVRRGPDRAAPTGPSPSEPAVPQPAPTVSFLDWLAGEAGRESGLLRAVLVLAGFSVAMAVLSYLREVTNTRLSMHKVFFIREAVYDQLQRIGLAYHDRVSTGELINRALSDLQNVRSFIQTAVLLTLEIVLIVGGYVLLLLTRSPFAALFALLPLPIWVAYTIRFSRRIRPAQEAVMKAGDHNVSLIAENIAGVHVVKAFGTEPDEISRYNRDADDFLAVVMRRIRMYANYTPVIRGISMASHLALFLLAGLLMVRGLLSPGDILMLGSAMGAILGRLQQVATINEQFQNAMVSGRRLYDVLAAAATIPAASGAQALPPGPGAVRFERVTFGYTPSRPVLQDVSFTVEPGEQVAIVGPTGAGKTTLALLLLRLYEPQQGRVCIDGVDLRSVTLDSLRTQVAAVFQETYLFSDTVAANIAYGRPDVRGPQIEAAARIAQADEFVRKLPRTYEAVLGERGQSLSGGQRQRLAIARALLADPRILILDDATAAVDPETEEIIHGGMRQLLRGRTVFIIAHRLNTVKNADRIIVLEGGRVTQIGTHAELLAADGHYREMALFQLQRDEHPPGRNPSHMDRMQAPDGVDAARAVAGVVRDEARFENEP